MASALISNEAIDYIVVGLIVFFIFRKTIIRLFDVAFWRMLWRKYNAVILIPLMVGAFFIVSYGLLYVMMALSVLMLLYIAGYILLGIVALIIESLSKNKNSK